MLNLILPELINKIFHIHPKKEKRPNLSNLKKYINNEMQQMKCNKKYSHKDKMNNC